MKLKFTLGIFFTFLATFILMSHSGGRAASFGAGNTGAPGETSQTCANCHNGGNFGASLDITIMDGDGVEVTSYLPGEQYTLEASFSTTSAPNGYGMQLVSLIDADDTDTEGLSNPSSNAQISAANARNYLEQAGLSASETFSATWTAPESGAGSVTFYAYGHAANGNGTTSGDQATSTTFQLAEGDPSSTNFAQLDGLSIQPNPAYNETRISWDNNTDAHIAIYDITGKLIQTTTVSGNSSTLNIRELRTGMYFVKVQDVLNNNSQTLRLIKK